MKIKSGFGRQYMCDFVFVVVSSLVNKGRVVDKIVFGCVMFGFQSVEEGFFGIKDLDGGIRRFGQVYEGVSVGNEMGINKVVNEGS